MSDERFEFYSDDVVIGVLDTVTGRTFNSFEIVDCLNEQQATITELNDELEESSAFIIEQREENKQLKKAEKINMEYAEQIVEENQKLRIAKNDLRREKEQLQKENEQLHLAIEDLLTHTSCDEIKKENEQLKKELKWKREEIKALIEESERYE